MNEVCAICGKPLQKEEFLSCPYCRREKEWERLSLTAPNFVYSKFPRGFQLTLSKYYQKDSGHYKTIKSLIKKMYNEEDNYYKSLFLYGETGEGKTTFACALVQEILRRMFINGDGYYEYQPLYTLYDFFCALKGTYTKTANECEQKILRTLERVPVLIVDDLGIEKGSEWEMYSLYGLVNNRTRELRTTIYTSNYSLDALTEKTQNDRITSRIASSSIISKYTRRH